MANPIYVKTVANQTQTTSTLAKNRNVKNATTKEQLMIAKTKESKLSNCLEVVASTVDMINALPH